MEPKEFKKVDEVLKKFEKRQSHLIDKDEWDELAKKITGSDCNHSAFKAYRNFLLDDGMIEKIDEAEGYWEYGITIKGRLKLMSGSYYGEYNRLYWSRLWNQTKSLVVLASTIIAALYSIHEIFFSDHNVIEKCIHYHLF